MSNIKMKSFQVKAKCSVIKEFTVAGFSKRDVLENFWNSIVEEVETEVISCELMNIQEKK